MASMRPVNVEILVEPSARKLLVAILSDDQTSVVRDPALWDSTIKSTIPSTMILARVWYVLQTQKESFFFWEHTAIHSTVEMDEENVPFLPGEEKHGPLSETKHQVGKLVCWLSVHVAFIIFYTIIFVIAMERGMPQTSLYRMYPVQHWVWKLTSLCP